MNLNRTLEVVKQCKSIAQVQQIHGNSISSGLLPLHALPILNNILSTLTSLLTRCSSRSITYYAVSLFHSIPSPTTFSFNTLIRIHTLLLSPLPALHLFSTLRRLSLPPDFHTFPFVLKACAQLRTLSLAQSLHSQAFKFGFLPDLFALNSLIRVYSIHHRLNDAHKLFCETPHRDVVSYNALIDGLLKTRQIHRARQLFDEMPVRDEVSWGTMIAGYSHSKLCTQAIQLFNEMMSLEVKPDNIALVSVLSACAQLGELPQGRSIHDYIQRNRIRVDSFLATGLVDLYAKCGCVETARDVFESCTEKDVFTWNAMLVGFAIHGEGSVVLEYFSRMIAEGVKPDGVSLLGVLVGCSHAGLVLEARKVFNEMETVYGVARESKHYGCMADMLARAGLIEEAVEMIKGMPCGGDVFAWGGLLGGCRIHGNVEIAKKAAQQVMEIKPEDGGVYSVLANIYAHTEQWDNLVNIRRSLSANKRAKKITGCTLLRSGYGGGRAAYTSSTVPKMKAHAPGADYGYVHHGYRQQHGKSAKQDFVPVYVAIGLIAMSTGLGLHTAWQQLRNSPTVRVKKERRETLPEVVEPEHVAEETHKYMKNSFFRKVAHVQDRSYPDHHHIPNPIGKDAYAYTPRLETLSSVGVHPSTSH
ncbi:Pentatricopeptide repeat-containing protein, partial [Mucuna pruriens]